MVALSRDFVREDLLCLCRFARSAFALGSKLGVRRGAKPQDIATSSRSPSSALQTTGAVQPGKIAGGGSVDVARLCVIRNSLQIALTFRVWLYKSRLPEDVADGFCARKHPPKLRTRRAAKGSFAIWALASCSTDDDYG